MKKRFGIQPLKKFSRKKMKNQIELLKNFNFDNLIILDACRADYFKEVIGDCEVAYSPAQCTREWLEEISILISTLGKFTLINSNPEATRTCPDVWKDRVDVWKTDWEYVTNKNLPTVPPWNVVDRIVNLRLRKKLVIFFIQPHGPYLKKGKELYVFKNPQATCCGATEQFSEKIIIDPKSKIEDPNDPLTREYIIEAYKGNLEVVWESVERLLGYLYGRIVITSDHGEALGEDGIYGHPCSWNYAKRLDVLRRVPWVEFC